MKMLTVLLATTLTFFIRIGAVRLSLVSMTSLSVVAFVAANTSKGEEGLIRGSLRAVIHELDGQRRTEQLDFILACDRDCCLTGTCKIEPEKSQPIEQFSLANRGNEFGILITVSRHEGNALTADGKWSAKHIQELRKLKLEDSFESRYTVVEMGANSGIALPVYLSWNSVGVTRDTMQSALRGSNYRGENELGTLEILGTQGIGRISLKKSSSSLHSPGWVPLSKLSGPYYPNGLTSMVEEYSFSPERRFGEHEAFQCLGSITETVPDGRSRKTEIKIQVTEFADAKTARKYINTLLEKLPNNQKIISNAGIDVATVLDKGRQKVAVDRDVERLTETRFNNESPSFYYYAIVLFVLVILGMIGYVRWSQKVS